MIKTTVMELQTDSNDADTQPISTGEVSLKTIELCYVMPPDDPVTTIVLHIGLFFLHMARLFLEACLKTQNDQILRSFLNADYALTFFLFNLMNPWKCTNIKPE